MVRAGANSSHNLALCDEVMSMQWQYYTISYVNKDMAGALGLSSTYEKVSVNDLNENVETFDSMPVSLTLESWDGNVKIPFQALTCPCWVTRTHKILDWQRYLSKWPHLSVCKFSDPVADPMVDLLIGQAQIDLHFSKCNVKEDPEEPVARLGPLGWSCIGHPDRRTTQVSYDHCSYERNLSNCV